MIVAEHVSKFYGPFAAVRDLDFRIEAGECVGFLGLNGAGKSTTLRMLAGVLEPTAGSITIDGNALHAEAFLARARIGYLPDRPPLYDEMPVRAYLRFAARLRGMAPTDATTRVAEVIPLCGLEAVADEVIATLSHGFRQRVGIAQAIVHRPALLILDEPTQGLDPVQVIEMRALIRNLRGRHTILLSTHILPEIEATCDRILLLHEGRIAAQGQEHELARRFGAGGPVELEVAAADGGEARLRAALQRWNATLDVTALGDGVWRATVDVGANGPEELAAAVIHAGLGLRGLRRLTSGLETAFQRLSHAGLPANPGRGAP